MGNATGGVLIFGFMSLLFAGNALAQCSANPPYKTVTYDDTVEKVKKLHGKTEIRQFIHVSPYLTGHPDTVTRLKPESPGDCKAEAIFPKCSELEIRSAGGKLSMTLKDVTNPSAPKTFIDALPLHPSGAKVDYLKSEYWTWNGKDLVFFVYLKDERVSQGTMAKNYLVEAFDVAEPTCEMYRPDLHPDQIVDAAPSAAVWRQTSKNFWVKTSKSAAKVTERCESDGGTGHEGTH
jgi:hypothetical protein